MIKPLVITILIGLPLTFAHSKDVTFKENPFPVPCKIECGNSTTSSFKENFCKQEEVFVAKKGLSTLDDILPTQVQVCSVFYFNTDSNKKIFKDYVDKGKACLRGIKPLAGEDILEERPMIDFQETEKRNCDSFDLDLPDFKFPRGSYCESKNVKITQSGKLDVYSDQYAQAEKQLKELEEIGFCIKH